MLLYFLGGLLPNPDGPWSPTASNCHAWLTGVLLEAVIAAVSKTEQRFIHVPGKLLDVLVGLGMARILALLAMIAMLVRRQYALKSLASKSTAEERRGLLENGQGPAAGYNGAHGHAHGPPPGAGRPGNVEKGWFDYFAGFKVLFPYLW